MPMSPHAISRSPQSLRQSATDSDTQPCGDPYWVRSPMTFTWGRSRWIDFIDKESMLHPDVFTVDAGEMLAVAASKMQLNAVGSLAVLREGGFAGITRGGRDRLRLQRLAGVGGDGCGSDAPGGCVRDDGSRVPEDRRTVRLRATRVRRLRRIPDGMGLLDRRLGRQRCHRDSVRRLHHGGVARTRRQQPRHGAACGRVDLAAHLRQHPRGA